MKNALNEYLNTPFAANEKATPDQVKNNTGGYVHRVNDVQRLTRFLVLGSDGGSYYVGQRDMTKQNVDFIVDMIANDEAAVVDTLVNVSVNARAPKNSTALFVLALVFVHGKDKHAAEDALLKVARTGTHLFEFVSYLKALGGLGRAKRRAIANWYLNKNNLALQVVKYRNRSDYSHRDLLRLSHPVGLDKSIGDFILSGHVDEDSPEIIQGFYKAQRVENANQAVRLLKDYPALPWEAFPTSVHKAPEFWKALFYNGMGQTALLRNVTRFAKLGLFDDVKFAGDVADALSDFEAISKGRMHPVQYLNALFIYTEGPNPTFMFTNLRNPVPWTVNAKVAGALEKGFYKAFDNVIPAGKRTMVSLDVSGSMTWASPAGLAGLNCMQAAVAMAMVTVRTEPYVEVNAFSGGLQKVGITDTDSLKGAIARIDGLMFGSTNIAAPIEKALNSGQVIDTFLVFTDNEVNRGTNVTSALKEYRSKVNPEARLIVVGMTATEFTVAPGDDKALDVVGFDAAAPGVIADFSAGRL